MSITVTSGCNVTPPRPSPWDAAGSMSTHLPNYQRLFEWIATPRFHLKHCVIYYSSAPAGSLYLPPIPYGATRQIMVSHTDKVSSIQSIIPAPGSTWSAAGISVSTSWVNWAHQYSTLASGRWNAAVVNVVAASSWGTTTGLTVSIRSTEPSPISAGYGAANYGGYNATLDYAHMAPCVPMSTPTGLSSSIYNSLVRQVERALVCPVLHAAYCGYYSFTDAQSVLNNRIWPVALRKDAPEEQRRVSFVIVTNANQESTTSSIIVRRGDRFISVAPAWRGGSLIEYRWTMDYLMEGDPDVAAAGRDIYYVRLETEIKNNLYSAALWGGLYNPL